MQPEATGMQQVAEHALYKQSVNIQPKIEDLFSRTEVHYNHSAGWETRDHCYPVIQYATDHRIKEQ